MSDKNRTAARLHICVRSVTNDMAIISQEVGAAHRKVTEAKRELLEAEVKYGRLAEKKYSYILELEALKEDTP